MMNIIITICINSALVLSYYVSQKRHFLLFISASTTYISLSQQDDIIISIENIISSRIEEEGRRSMALLLGSIILILIGRCECMYVTTSQLAPFETMIRRKKEKHLLTFSLSMAFLRTLLTLSL